MAGPQGIQGIQGIQGPAGADSTVVGPAGPAGTDGQDGATADPVQVTTVEATTVEATVIRSATGNPLTINSASGELLTLLGLGTANSVGTPMGAQLVSALAPLVLETISSTEAGGKIILKTKDTANVARDQVVVNQQGLALGTNGGQYINMTETFGSSGYGLRGNANGATLTADVLEVRNTINDDWGQPYHSNAVSGQGAYWEGVTAITLGSPGPTHTLTTGFNSIPSIVTTYLECLTPNAGYVQGDHVIVSSTSNTNVGATGFSLIFDGSATNDVTVRIGTGDMYLNHKTTGGQTKITNANWQMRIKAWK